MEYSSFKYIFPPRPEIKAPQTSIERFEELGFIAQPKLNGSCGLLFTNGKEFKFMNRHRLEFAKTTIPREELLSLHRGKNWTVLVGEHMNKSQRGADKKIFNGKYVIFDILVHDGKHLVGSTFEERQKLLEKLYKSSPHDNWISRVSENVYRVKNFSTGIGEQWKEITSVEMYEGFVFKKKIGKLDLGFKKANNMSWQVKVRKPTKNYSY